MNIRSKRIELINEIIINVMKLFSDPSKFFWLKRNNINAYDCYKKIIVDSDYEDYFDQKDVDQILKLLVDNNFLGWFSNWYFFSWPIKFTLLVTNQNEGHFEIQKVKYECGFRNCLNTSYWNCLSSEPFQYCYKLQIDRNKNQQWNFLYQSNMSSI